MSVVVDDDEWPGFEALPPSPPTEWPARRWYGPSTEHPARRRVVGWLVGFGAAAIALLVLVAIVSRDERREVDEGALPPATQVAPEAVAPPMSSTTTSTIPPDPTRVQAEVDELSAFVEATRGLPFKGPVAVEVLSDDEFRGRVDATWPRGTDQAQEAKLKAFGVIRPDVPYAEELRDLRLELTAALYDADHDTLVLRDGEIDDVYRSTVVHELTHALDDQWFGLVRPQYADADDEIEFGFRALVEGDAERVEHAYIDELPPGRGWTYGSGSAPAPEGVDPAVAEAFYSPYDLGEALVVEVFDTLGQTGLDAAFGDPPTTSEQVRFPNKYIAREPRIPVDAPPADGPIVDEGVTGMLLTEAMLRPLMDADRAAMAAEGWGGDWFVSWLTDDDALQCWRTAYVMDSEADREELIAALRTWVANGSDRTVEITSAGPVHVTACGPPVPNPDNRD